VHRAAPPATVALGPTAPDKELPTVPAGSTLTLPGNFLGDEPGSVLMVFNKIKLPVTIRQWSTNGVTVTLPPMAINGAVVIRLDVVLPNGHLGKTQDLRVTAPSPVILHPAAPSPNLPTQAALAPIQPGGQANGVTAGVSLASPLATRGSQVQMASPPANPATSVTSAPPIMLPPVSGPSGPSSNRSVSPATSAPIGGRLSGQGTPQSPLVLPAVTRPNPPANAPELDPLQDNPILREHLEGTTEPSDLPSVEIEMQEAPSELEAAPAELPTPEIAMPEELWNEDLPTDELPTDDRPAEELPVEDLPNEYTPDSEPLSDAPRGGVMSSLVAAFRGALQN
jgi:hypothetical protein